MESYRLQTLCEGRERRRGYPAVVNSGKIAVLEKTLAGMGDDEPLLAGKKVLEKELEKLQKKLNGPKKTAKHIEAKQNWIDRESKRLEAESARLTELQENLRVWKETLKVGLRGNQDPQRGPSERGRNDGRKQEPLLVSGRHGGHPEARTTRTGVLERVGFEETGWVDTRRFSGGNRWLDDGGPETQQRSRSKEAKTARDDREGIKERCQNGRCHGRFGWFSVVMRVQTRILQEISECKQHEKEKEFGSVECCDRSGVLESVELECGWSVRRLYRHFPVADFNARRLGCVAVVRMFQKTGWGGCWCARIVHAVRTLGRIAMSGSYRQSDLERTIEDAVELDGQLTLISAHLPRKGSKLGEFEATLTELQEFLNGRPKQHVILGGDFNVNLFGMTDYLQVGESIPRPRTLVDTNDSLRARALHTMVTELDLTVTNTWMNADTERELFTRSSWSNPEDSLTQMNFIMTSRKLEMKRVQVLDSDWFKTDHRAVYAVLSLRPKMRYTVKNAANLRGWVPDDSWHDAAAATLTDWKSWNKLAPVLVETAKDHRKVESKEMSVTEMELQTLLLGTWISRKILLCSLTVMAP